MDRNRVLGVALVVVGIFILVLTAYAIWATGRRPNSEMLVSLAFPEIAIGLLMLAVGLWHVGENRRPPSRLK